MKKFLKIAAIGILIILILAQVPFVYRRYQTANLVAKIAEMQANRTLQSDPQFKEFKGIIHAHTALGGHSTGSFDELIAGANANNLDFVLLTEHYSDAFDTSALTLNGVYGKTLFVGGNEIDTADSDRFLMIPGSSAAAGFRNASTTAFLEKSHAENRLALITYPEKFKSWESSFDGIEVFSIHTAAKKMNPFTVIFDAFWSFPVYPEMTLASQFVRPDDNLKRFDEIAVKRKTTLFPGTDAHSNIGFHLFGDDAGNKVFNIKIDDYKTIFGIVRAHVLLPNGEEFSRDNLISALRSGHSYIGFDVFGDTDGFHFSGNNGVTTAIMGDDLSLAPETTLTATASVEARFDFYKNGVLINTNTSDELSATRTITVNGPGTYRVEVYLASLGGNFAKMPWIISNPIYIR